jgi:replicative DNA helicase
MTDQLPEEFQTLILEAHEPDRPDTRVIEETLLTALFAGQPDLTARVIADTRPKDYYFDLYRRLADKIYPELAQGKHVDAVTLAASLPEPDPTDKEKVKARQDLLDLVGRLSQAAQTPPEAGRVEAYLSIFVEQARKRTAKEAIKKVEDALDAGDLSPADAFSKATEVILDQEASRRMVGAFKSEAEDWPTYFADLEAKQDPKHTFTGLNTGFDHLNNLANGLTEGLFVVGASPATGKTTWAKQLSDQVVTLNLKAVCLFVSLEQSREELRVKTLSRLSGIENRDILRGRLDVKAPGWQKIKTASSDFLSKTAGRYFILEGDKSTTPERIRLAALQVQRATRAETLLIVIDYLQIVPTVEDYKDPRSRVDAVVSDLRRVARDLGASVLAISSVGRASYDTAGLSAFKESGGIEYGADLGAIMLPSKDGNGKTQKGTSPIDGVNRKWIGVDLAVVKNRNGERGKIEFQFFPEISRFVETGQTGLTDDPWEAANNG